MSVDLEKTQFASTNNSFKNTGVYTISIDLPTSYAAFQDKTNSTSITLSENQVFVFAAAKYAEYIRAVNEGVVTKYWQVIPTFDGYAVSGSGPQQFYLYTTINGNQVTFIVGSQNGYATPETYTPQTIEISYVTYTVDS